MLSESEKNVSKTEKSKELSDGKTENILFEDALDLAGMGKYNYALFGVLSLTLLSVVCEMIGSSYVATASTCDLGLTTETRGLLSAMPMLGGMSSSPLWGWLADTKGRKSILIASMVGTCIIATGSSLSVSWQMYAACKFLSFFLASACTSVTYTILGESTPLKYRNRMIILLSTILMLNQGIVTLIAYPILHMDFNYQIFGLNYRPWRLLQTTYGLCAGLSAVLLWLFVKESPKFYASLDKNDLAIKVLSEMYRINSGNARGAFSVKSLQLEEGPVYTKRNFVSAICHQTFSLFKPPLLRNTLILVYIIIIVLGIPISFYMWVPAIMNSFASYDTNMTDTGLCELIRTSIRGANTTIDGSIEPACTDTISDLSYFMLIIIPISFAILNTINSLLLNLLDKRTLVICYMIVCGAAGLVIPLVGSTPVAFILFFIFIMATVLCAITTAYSVELYPTYLRATAVCVTMMFGRLSSFILISILGTLLETHCEVSMYCLSSIFISGALIAFMLPGDVKIKDES